MSAWKAARIAGQSSRMNQIKQRSDSKFDWWEGYYDIEDGKCYFCRSKRGRKTTGYLKMSGAILVCNADTCKEAYVKEKKFQSTY